MIQRLDDQKMAFKELTFCDLNVQVIFNLSVNFITYSYKQINVMQPSKI
jgi:hypothetical protein